MSAYPQLDRVIAAIHPPEERFYMQARSRLDSLTKPLGSLGELESLAAQMVAIASGEVWLPLRKAVYVLAADHGVTQAGVSAYPPEVTAQMVRNFLGGGAAVRVLSALHGVNLTVVDVGVDADFTDTPGLRRAKVRRGTRNMLCEAAMTGEELSRAFHVGLDLAQHAQQEGHHLIAVGEMGIGNTTAASAMTALLTGQSVENVTGCGTGLDDVGRSRKLDVIRRSIRLHFPDTASRDPFEILRTVGGLEIAAMAGLILGAAANRRVVVCDGFISTAAAAFAYAVAPNVKPYLIAGHCSQEPGHVHLLRYLELRAVLHLDMRLGEATGAVLAIPIIESALQLYAMMSTFASAGVSEAER